MTEEKAMTIWGFSKNQIAFIGAVATISVSIGVAIGGAIIALLIGLGGDINALRSDMNANDNALRSDMNANDNALRDDIQSLDSRVDALSVEAAETNASIRNVETRLDAVESRLNAVESRLNGVERQLLNYGSVDDRLDVIEREQTRLNEVVSDLVNAE